LATWFGGARDLDHLPLRWRSALALRASARHVPDMLNVISILIGVVVLICALVGFIPLLGWLNWLLIPIAIVGAALAPCRRVMPGAT